MSLRTGNKVVTKLRKYINGYPTNEIKDNVQGDDDYIAPYEDVTACPKHSVELDVSAQVQETVPPDSSTVCQPCYTKDQPLTVCYTYTLTAFSGANFSYVQGSLSTNIPDLLQYQYTDCEDRLVKTGWISAGQSVTVKSLTEPVKSIGKARLVTNQIGQQEGYQDIDENMYHYLASDCYEKLTRVVRSDVELNIGDVVKTPKSTCCWEVQSLVSPRVAFDIVYAGASSIHESCSDCCGQGDYLTEPDARATFTGNTTVSINHEDVTAQIAKFNVTQSGYVKVEITLDRTAGSYLMATGTLRKSVGALKSTIVTFPLSTDERTPYVVNRSASAGGGDNAVVEASIKRLDPGIYTLMINPLFKSSDGEGTCTITVTAL